MSKSKRSELRDDIRYLSRRCESYFGFYYNTYDQDELTHPRDDSWVTIAAPIPFVPPVTRAFLEFRSQKLAGGGAGTLDELLDAYATEETMAAIPRMKKREIMAHKHNNASKNSPRPRKAEKRHNKTDGPPRTARTDRRDTNRARAGAARSLFRRWFTTYLLQKYEFQLLIFHLSNFPSTKGRDNNGDNNHADLRQDPHG